MSLSLPNKVRLPSIGEATRFYVENEFTPNSVWYDPFRRKCCFLAAVARRRGCTAITEFGIRSYVYELFGGAFVRACAAGFDGKIFYPENEQHRIAYALGYKAKILIPGRIRQIKEFYREQRQTANHQRS